MHAETVPRISDDACTTLQVLESRTHVVADARDRLGMHVPSASEIVILPLKRGSHDRIGA